MSSHSVLILLRRLGGRAGVAKVHRFRHTFATWAIENEARELDVHKRTAVACLLSSGKEVNQRTLALGKEFHRSVRKREAGQSVH